MSRWWTETVARLGDRIPLGVAAIALIALAGLVAAALYWWPSWLPTRWRMPRWRSIPRWRRRRRASAAPAPTTAARTTVAEGEGELPDLPLEAFVSLADRLAAEGRFAESVRERLRGIVRELVDRRVVENHPGWTVTELAAAAGGASPPVRPALDAACRTFSDIWYGMHPATSDHDGQMRGLADEVHAALVPAAAGGRR